MESEMIESKQEADAGIQANGTIQFSTFYLKGQLLGVGVHRVQEVMKYQEMSRIPLARDYVAGLINLRGQIVTLLDLRARLGLPPREDQRASMNVVVNSAEGPVSLMVDEIGDVLDVAQKDIVNAPPTVSGTIAEYVQGVCKLEGELLVMLDVDLLLEA